MTRTLTFCLALLALAGCGGLEEEAPGAPAEPALVANAPPAASGGGNSAAPQEGATPQKPEVAGLPAGFPGRGEFRGTECIIFIRLAREGRGAGQEDAAIEGARQSWESDLQARVGDDWRKVADSAGGMLARLTATQRDAATRWCVENAPTPEPEAEAAEGAEPSPPA